MVGRELFTQGVLQDLAGRIAGHRRHQLELLGDLLGHQPRVAAERDHLGQLESVRTLGELHDRALWTPLVTATGAGGSTTALVGSYETVAQALLDYVDIGCELLSIRGWDPLNDAIDYARYVLPLVRAELAGRPAARVPVPASG